SPLEPPPAAQADPASRPRAETPKPTGRGRGSKPLTGEKQSPATQSAGGRPAGNSGKIGLNLDQVISDYLKRSSEQGKLDLKVISPNVFIAGKSISLKVRVIRSAL